MARLKLKEIYSLLTGYKTVIILLSQIKIRTWIKGTKTSKLAKGMRLKGERIVVKYQFLHFLGN